MNVFPQYRSLGRILAGVLILAFSLALLALLVFYLVQDTSIWVLGQRVTGEVVDFWVERTNEDEQEVATFQYLIRYRFTTSDGRVITAVSVVGPNEWLGMTRGARLRDGAYPFFNGDRPHRPGVVYYDDAPMSGITGGRVKGGPIDVVYFPLYPTFNRLDETRFIPVLACAYIPLILLGWVGLAVGRYLVWPASGSVEGWSFQRILRQNVE
jgi:hypothetical protein